MLDFMNIKLPTANKGKTDWTFKDVSPGKYELTMSLNVESEYAIGIFEKNSQKALAETLIKSAPDLKMFKLDSQYHGLIKTALSGKIKEINKDLKKKGINITTYELSEESRYTKLNDTFKVYLFVTGYYTKL